MSSLQNHLEKLAVPLSSAEVHGVASGLLCAATSARAKSLWFRELLEAADLQADAVAAHGNTLKALDSWFADVVQVLNSEALVYDPLIPDESEPLMLRLRGLGDFCSGYCYGLALAAGENGNQPLSPEVREIVEDFQAIDNAADESVDNNDESHFVELLEYVRVGVLVVLEAMRPVTRQVNSDDAPNSVN